MRADAGTPRRRARRGGGGGPPPLAEGQGALGVLALARELRDTDAVLCSHGDVVRICSRRWWRPGTKLKDELRWRKKRSTWVLTWDGDRLAKGRYLSPPG